jgi:hypothetical protein
VIVTMQTAHSGEEVPGGTRGPAAQSDVSGLRIVDPALAPSRQATSDKFPHMHGCTADGPALQLSMMRDTQTDFENCPVPKA